MKNEENVTHTRYYIFHHTGSGENLMYRTGEGSWHEDFDKAELWSDLEFARKKAKTFAYQNTKVACMSNRIVVIGSVKVTSDPFFPLEVIGV